MSKKNRKEKESYSKEWLTRGEIRRLFASPDISSRDLLIMKVTYYGALRIGETIKSRREDYRNDPYPHLLLRDQKTDKNNWEVQPIPLEIYGDVQRYCEDHDIRTQDPVFQSNRDRQIAYNTVYKMVRRRCKEAGIDKNITTHSFRRSRATHLLNAGVMDIYKVSKFLRHKRIETTRSYLKLSKQQMYEYMEASDKEAMLDLL
jgi:integrase/recombinase XerD